MRDFSCSDFSLIEMVISNSVVVRFVFLSDFLSSTNLVFFCLFPISASKNTLCSKFLFLR
jgi:hypothetical protein